MRTIRRRTRTRNHKQQRRNKCEKEFKRHGLVKKPTTSERVQCVCLFISSSFVLSLSDSVTVLSRACGFKREKEKKPTHKFALQVIFESNVRFNRCDLVTYRVIRGHQSMQAL